MKSSRLLLATITLALAIGASAQTTKFESQPGGGNQVKIDGTSTIHDWSILGALIAGSLELDSKFLADPSKAQAGKIDGKADVRIPVRTLKSGKPSMDNVTYPTMDQPKYPMIEYHSTELTLKEAPKAAAGPWTLDSKGQLIIHGTTNTVSFPVTMTREGKTIKTVGAVTMKMTDYNVQPPAPKILGMPTIKTGDEIKLSFTWITAEK
jgi:polyisoprenoid-binding protein YceI